MTNPTSPTNEHDEARPAKRARTAASATTTSAIPAVAPAMPALPQRPPELDAATVAACFTEGLFNEDYVQHLANNYKASHPYLHCVMHPLVREDLLRAVRAEIMGQLHFTEKETDIYKVNQTGDLANIDGLPLAERAALGHLHKLRNAFYSEPFRNFVSAVTGCGPLSGSKQDMSINNYRQGCHLLNHDDVIGTRRVSYILYLPPPDEEWKVEYGGALELYPCVKKGTPATDPTVVLPPKYNQFIFFTVQPGYSFHSVQEVVVPNDRLSISGWFHVPQDGEDGYQPMDVVLGPDAAPASLAQLEEDAAADNDETSEYPYRPVSTDEDLTADLSDADRAYLAQFLHPQYLTPAAMTKMNDQFCDESSLQLRDFFKPEIASTLAPLLNQADARDRLANGDAKALAHGAGVRAGWAVQGSPVKQRFMVLTGDSAASTESPECAPLRAAADLLVSPAFARWLYHVTGIAARGTRHRVRRFRPGLDYTLAAYSSTSATLDVTVALTPSPRTAWEEGEIGGYECYVAPDESNDDPAVYRAAGGNENDEDGGALLTVPADWNVLSLVLRDQGVMRFVKYVSGLAPGSRWDIAMEVLPVPDEEDAEDAE
ncbi:hypothetical protein AMAG_05048 [Allomyces macrogynus ATCC 38327]|uniref:uS12 prolyl 3,4-dihydroxylase n=1 Tax=Allomyces macrogynus (strain ATCC 38327) TaxID=578462 RepID=A0A0L0S6K7_ALLM3|nr:hypothetical protein AMAG_05048 [Allomyces macrogynus ATCC 38327]|eukprot:KNE58238.1 hypothetical protein AMAG_05048 [Allomyces macrogynus ATCC 38327]